MTRSEIDSPSRFKCDRYKNSNTFCHLLRNLTRLIITSHSQNQHHISVIHKQLRLSRCYSQLIKINQRLTDFKESVQVTVTKCTNQCFLIASVESQFIQQTSYTKKMYCSQKQSLFKYLCSWKKSFIRRILLSFTTGWEVPSFIPIPVVKISVSGLAEITNWGRRWYIFLITMSV